MIWFPRLLSFSTGFLSLSQEILWVRLASFSYKGIPQAFAFALGMYLIGIMLGAAVGKRYCEKNRDLVRISGRVLLIAGFSDILLPCLFLAALALGWLPGLGALAFALIVTAGLKSVVFPIAHHLGSSKNVDRVASSVSKVYFANIIGSTLGPLVTGFVLLELFTLQQCMLLMAALTFAVAASCFMRPQEQSAPAISGAAIGGAVLVIVAAIGLPNLLMPAMAHLTSEQKPSVATVIENRYGIIHTARTSDGEETIYGGNVYDGTFNTDLVKDTNQISRTFLLAALHPNPKRVLMIGLSGGAWAHVLLGIPEVTHFDAVEINAGYVDLINERTSTADVLRDPRFFLHIDDGRRWLKRHPNERYDLIVMNTTFHWRAYSSLLLGQEFIQLAKGHLNPGGILAYNSTSSRDVFKTAASVFPHVYRYRNFVYASDRELSFDLSHLGSRLAVLRLHEKPMVNVLDPIVSAKLQSIVSQFDTYNDAEESRRTGRTFRIITEQNMITEYRYGAYYQGLFYRGWP